MAAEGSGAGSREHAPPRSDDGSDPPGTTGAPHPAPPAAGGPPGVGPDDLLGPGTTDPAEAGGRVSEYLFAAEAGAPRRRRAADVWRLVYSGTVFVLLGWTATSESPLDLRIAALFAETPSWIDAIAWFAYSGAALASFTLCLIALVRGGVGRGVLRDLFLAIAAGVVIAVAAARWTTDTWPLFVPEVYDAVGGPAYPTVRIALVAIIILTLATYLTAPVRRFGRWLTLATVLAPIVLGLASLTAALGALLLAVFSVSLVRLALGSPEGLPPVGRLAETLRRFDVPTENLAYLPRQPGTVGLATATAVDGRPLTIKVYGRDAADRERSERVWRSMWYRHSGPTPSAGRIEQVEHEALALMLMDRLGITAPVPLRGGEYDGDVVLVTIEPGGRDLRAIEDDDGLADVQLGEVWATLERLHRGRVTHGGLGATTVRLGPSGPAFVEVQHASLLPSPQQYGADVAALLGTTAALVGVERAADVAVDAFDRRRLVDALPFLQDAVVEPELRDVMKHAHVGFDALRDGVATRLGVDQPHLASVRRVSVQDVVMVVAGVIAANALISQVTQVGFSTLVDEVASASLGWLVVALLVKLSSYSTAYLGLSGAVTQPVPFGPTCLLQSANSFVGLVVPSTVGRVAMSVRFLQKLGVPTATALAQGPIVSFIGFLIQIALLLLTSRAVGESLDSGSLLSHDGGGLLAIAVAVVAVGLIVVFAVPKLRRLVLPRVSQAYHSVRVIVTSPTRLGKICFGELLANLLEALALGATTAAFGVHIGFAALVFVSVGTVLLAGIAPVPGGIGVAEATMTALLTGLGLPSEQAFSIAITFRVVTAYLPPVLGFFSMRWLTGKGYI